MGLAQRRIVQEYQSSNFGDWKKTFDAVVGFEIPMDVKWDTMQDDDYSKRDDYFTWYEAVYFRPLTTAFQNLCGDSMGKDAVKASVKKIVISGAEGSSPKHSKFENGVVTI